MIKKQDISNTGAGKRPREEETESAADTKKDATCIDDIVPKFTRRRLLQPQANPQANPQIQPQVNPQIQQQPLPQIILPPLPQIILPPLPRNQPIVISEELEWLETILNNEEATPQNRVSSAVQVITGFQEILRDNRNNVNLTPQKITEFNNKTIRAQQVINDCYRNAPQRLVEARNDFFTVQQELNACTGDKSERDRIQTRANYASGTIGTIMEFIRDTPPQYQNLAQYNSQYISTMYEFPTEFIINAVTIANSQTPIRMRYEVARNSVRTLKQILDIHKPDVNFTVEKIIFYGQKIRFFQSVLNEIIYPTAETMLKDAEDELKAARLQPVSAEREALIARLKAKIADVKVVVSRD
jgi:hypothetical protein